MRRLALTALTLFVLAVPLPALAHDDHGSGTIDIVEVSGVLDRSMIDFAIGRIEAAQERGVEAVVIQLDSQATVSDRLLDLVDAIRAATVPVVVWVGPDPAVAYGGSVAILAAAPIRAAAPGVEIGYAAQLQAGGERFEVPEQIADDPVVVGVDDVELVDLIAPSIANLLVELNGTPVPGGEAEEVLVTLEDGPDGSTPVPTVFWEPGIGTRTLRLAVTPEAVFFFLVMGLMVAAFEFYAIGPGIAAAVAAACLLIASYGLVILPIRWWSVGLVVFALWLMTVDYQRGGAGAMTWVGAVVLFIGGLFITDAAPQLAPSWWVVLVVVASALLWYMFAMTTVARSRFSTPTIGRDHMVGRLGVAVTAFSPLGEVEVDGARWSATAHREAGLTAGAAVQVVGVDGRYLEVEPVPDEPAES